MSFSIDRAKFNKSTDLYINDERLNALPDDIGDLVNLTVLCVNNNHLKTLPHSIGRLIELTNLNLHGNQLTVLPSSIGKLINLTYLYLSNNRLTTLPDSINNLSSLTHLSLHNNQLTTLPDSISGLVSLSHLYLNNNPIVDLSILQKLPNLRFVDMLGVFLPRRYWIKFSDWNSQWLLDEDNAEIRRVLMTRLGYEQICSDLKAITIDTWREYNLLEINNVERVYEYESDSDFGRIVPGSMKLLKMTCPSTAHIHILRVPPQMTSAEASIVWINHGIHPDRFAVQT